MIPKKIHYVWLGGGKFTPSVQRCVDSWKRVMPDYELKCWNEDNFDVNSVIWVKEAIESRKWSLASDYIRHYAIYNEGGIYFDTDVYTYKPLDEFLKYDFFTSIEFHPSIYEEEGKYQIDKEGNSISENNVVRGIGVLAAGFGATAGNPFIKECMDFFGSRHYIKEDGTFFEDIINPGIMAMLLTKYGFRYFDKKQLLDNNMVIFPSTVLAGSKTSHTKDSYLMHWCDRSWIDKSEINWKGRIMSYLSQTFPYIFRR